VGQWAGEERRAGRLKKQIDPRLLVWAWGSWEADFWRFYQIDLNELAFKSSMSLRRFSVLVRGLPENSAYVRWLKNKGNRDMAEQKVIDEEIFKRGG